MSYHGASGEGSLATAPGAAPGGAPRMAPGGPEAAAPAAAPAISVLIPTKNEERDLPGCLASVAWCDDIHVYDSMSTDATVAVAQAAGAAVTQRSYEDSDLAFGGDEAAHRNWGLANIPFKHPWVLHLDADERCNPALMREMDQAVRDAEHGAFEIRRRDFLGSTWLKHVQASPYYIRLFRPEAVHYERLINPITVVDGTVGRLTGYFDHYPFSKGLSDWVRKHNHYSTLEARQIVREREAGAGGAEEGGARGAAAGERAAAATTANGGAAAGRADTGGAAGGAAADEPSARTGSSLLKALTACDFHERRRHQKALFYRLPCRPLLKFLLLYVGRLGFLDGRAGYTYARLQSIYEYLIVLKTRELEKEQAKPGDIPGAPNI